ncbi:hemagglutinin repeat-containing protein [Alcanivorax sp.]|uniref:hemagglutinin repeat-containing protein n=1 Tax=Alcanivorax sp. TaxID=1872427 RepID=UPI000C59CDD4|nr:hemagglutinin repeat-containing protein [Alcanivorax sp.]MBQ23347.1 hypothetical protein [Alcanivorax sp.]
MNLLASASNDFSIIGSDLASDGGVQLSAGNDLLVASVANSDSYDFKVRHDGETSHNIQRSVRQQGSSVTAGGDVVMESGNDLTAIASRLEAGEDLSLMGKGDISILAALDSNYSYSYEEDDGSFGRSKTATIENETKNAIGSLLTAGGTLSLAAEAGDVELIASTGHGEEGVEVEAGRNLHIESGVNSAYTRVQTTDKNAARIKTRDTGSMNQTLAQAGLSSGGDISLDAQGDVVLGAADLAATGDLRIGDAALATDESGAMALDENGNPIIERGSIDNLYIGTVALENENWDIKTRSLRGPVKELAKASSVIMGVGGMYLPGLALGAKDLEVTLSESTESRVHERREIGSALQAENIQLSAQNDMTLTGSSLKADEESGKVVMLADNILLDTAVTETTTTEKDETETASSIDPSLKKDEISLGGLRLTELEQATVTKTLTHSGSSISGNQIVLEADSALSLINADIEATGEDGILSLAGDSVSITGVQDEKTVTETLKEKTTETSVGIRNAYVDAAYAIEGLKKAGDAVGDAKDALKDAERRVERGELAKEALEDYRIMLAAASANLVQAELASTQALAATAAGAAAGGTGFYVSGSAQHSETTSTSTTTEKTWQGSSLNAAAMSINADKTASIIGSEVNAGVLDLNAADILIGAGTNEQSSRFEQESKNGGFSVSTSGAGSWNANAGFNEAESESQATQYVNSQLNVGHLNSTSDSLTVKGGVVTANTANIDTGTLHIESLQDTHSSSNSSVGANIGVGGGTDSVGKPQGGSAGFNMANGSSEGAKTNQQSAILIADGENSQITAKDTALIGGMIANASYEEDAETGEFVLMDHGNLNFSTETLSVEDLRDYSKSDQQGGGLQVSKATTTISIQDTGHRMEGETRATIGGGNVTVGGQSLDEQADFASLNRNVGESQVVTLDQQTGGMNASVTVDNRVFTKEGREEIAEQHVNLKDNVKVTVAGAASDVKKAVDVGAQAYEITKETYDKLAKELKTKVHNLPKEYRELGQGMEVAFDDYLRVGGDPQAYKTFLESESFRDAAATLSTVRGEIDKLMAQGLTEEQIFTALEEALPGSTGSRSTISLSDGDVPTVEGTNAGIEMFHAVGDLSTELKKIEQEYGGEWLNNASLALGVLIAGPARLAMEVGGEQLLYSVAGEQIESATNATANLLTGMAHHTSPQRVDELVDYAVEGNLTDEWTQETEHKLATADYVENTQHGAKETVKYLLGTLIGVGVSKGSVTNKPNTLAEHVDGPNPLTGEGYGVNNPPVRIEGEWSRQDYFNALNGRTPKGLGKPDLHHADQMPGSGIHEVIPSEHRGNTALHGQPNQGVTPDMRKADKELHWWYRAREQGADELFPDWIYD